MLIRRDYFVMDPLWDRSRVSHRFQTAPQLCHRADKVSYCFALRVPLSHISCKLALTKDFKAMLWADSHSLRLSLRKYQPSSCQAEGKVFSYIRKSSVSVRPLASLQVSPRMCFHIGNMLHECCTFRIPHTDRLIKQGH